MGGFSAGRARAVMAACVVCALPTAVAPASPVAGPAYLAGLALVVAALWAGARRQTRSARTPWRLLALAASCWLAGDTLQRVLELFGRSADGVGPPDVLWLASYPLLAAAVVTMVNARGLPDAVAREIRLDVVVTSLASTVLAWHVLIVPALGEEAGSLRDAVVATLYPLGDVALFALALVLVMAPGRRGTAQSLLIGCFGLTLPFDLLAATLPRVAPGFDTSHLDGGLLVVNGLLGAAALHPSSRDLTRAVVTVAGHGIQRWRVVLLGASLCGVTLAAVLSGSNAVTGLPTAIAALVISATIVFRFYRAIREQEAAEAALAHQATHDQLTGAANRSLLVRRLEAAVAHGRRHGVDGGAGANGAGGFDDTDDPDDVDGSGRGGTGLTLVFVDLDGFKAVNDAHGHPAGDTVLRAVAARLAGLVRSTDTVARVGGDEFVLLCHDVAEQDAESLGHRVVEAVRQPVDVGGVLVAVGASVGVLHLGAGGRHRVTLDDRPPQDPAVTAGPGETARPVEAVGTAAPAGAAEPFRPVGSPAAAADALLRRVDTAMYEAKRRGGGVRTAQPVG